MLERKHLGIKGEELACAVLKTRGYEIIARNYITRIGEIDIIALKDRVVVFCEVKTRIAGMFGDGRDAVDARKQNKIRKCAEIFLMTTGISYDYCEFHVIEITAEHLKNCF
ncbi:MAG: YraN family protein [Firmicutes bacterium]|nr:YraN family protein [Bacillota bacterium]